MLAKLQAHLNSKNALVGPLSPIIDRIVESIPYQNVPKRMKQTIAVSEIMLLASQFRRNIHHWDGGEVTINSVAFIITGSGQNKDSSVNAARKCFTPAYDMINHKRTITAKARAKAQASEAGDDTPYEWSVYKKYYRAPNPLFVAPSTPEGFIQHLNDLDADGIGSGFLYSGEFGAELATNPLMVENIKVLAELYDLGNKEVKALKSRENQSKEIKGLPVSALLIGSPGNILYDENVKRKFKVEFSTKLARRSFFCFLPDQLPEADFRDISSLIASELLIENEAIAARMQISDGIKRVTEHNLSQGNSLLEVEPSVREMFIVYKRYNTEIAETIPKVYPISVLVRKHLQWKALKLAGAIAIFENSSLITEAHYIQAMRFCELLDKDMRLFEAELVKEQYEIFSDYMKSISIDGKSSIGLHELRKLGFIPSAGVPNQKMKDLIYLAASYDKDGVYSVANGSEIHYETPVHTDTVGLSYMPIDNTHLIALVEAKADKAEISAAKQTIAKNATNGYSYGATTFPELAELLNNDFAYSPFEFKNGIRSKETLVSKTKLLVLDIDDSDITAEECHYILQDLNHHIALSSDSTNNFKFRVILELDAEVDLNPIEWKYFYQSIANDLAIKVDPLPQSQIFYAYANRDVLSVTDKEKVEVRDHIMLAKDKASEKAPIAEKKLTTAQKEALLDNELDTFFYAFEAETGGGSRALLKAAYHAKDLGMSKEDIIELVYRINDYWVIPMENDRLQGTLINQIKRW